MSASYPVRTVQLGVVPVVTRVCASLFPDARTSLWQRDAKRQHRRIMATTPAVPVEGQLGKRVAAMVTVAGLLIAFHEAAPFEVELTEGDFAKLVEAALAAPIVSILLAGNDPLSEEGAAALTQALAIPSQRDVPSWKGDVARTGSAGTRDEGLRIEVRSCGLRDLCVREHRLFLLKHLCMVEEALAAACGCDLDRPQCIAIASRACLLDLARARTATR